MGETSDFLNGGPAAGSSMNSDLCDAVIPERASGPPREGVLWPDPLLGPQWFGERTRKHELPWWGGTRAWHPVHLCHASAP